MTKFSSCHSEFSTRDNDKDIFALAVLSLGQTMKFVSVDKFVTELTFDFGNYNVTKFQKTWTGSGEPRLRRGSKTPGTFEAPETDHDSKPNKSVHSS